MEAPVNGLLQTLIMQNLGGGKRGVLWDCGKRGVLWDGASSELSFFVFSGVSITSAQSVILITVPEGTNIGGMMNEDGWNHLSALDPSYPRDVPLYKSPQFDVGTVEFDPYVVTGSEPTSQGGAAKKYNIKVNVWFSPERTNCGIHNHQNDPKMLEVHTQIYGTGRMQKFLGKEFKSMYEDLIMPPGLTHDPFAGVKANGDIFYGWHQYYSDTDCIWMAIEHHLA